MNPDLEKILGPHSDWKQIDVRCMIQDIVDDQIFYCITIPGENQWARQTSNANLKLACDDAANPTPPSTDEDRLSISLISRSFPISDGINMSCFIKVYDNNLGEMLRVNNIVQVSGLVEPSEGGGTDMKAFGLLHDFDTDFDPAKDFPERLVPRIHVRSLNILSHINPQLSPVIDQEKVDPTRLKMARSRLSDILSQLFGGDTLITDYLILSLIAKVQNRKDVTTVGQLSLCLSGFKPEMKFLTEKLYEIISKITTHSHYIDLSLANLNNLRFTPEKDHQNNKMIAGTLQLPHGLYLMLNETALSEGLLTVQGTSNLNTLKQVIRSQKLNYNFKYHSVEIDTDLKILVISEGKSLLPIHLTIPVEKNDAETISEMSTACEAVNDFLSEELLNMFRYYITYLTNVSTFDIPDELTKLMSDEFVNRRKKDEENNRVLYSQDDFGARVTLARYLTISHGETTLTRDIWEQVGQMETARLARLGA